MVEEVLGEEVLELLAARAQQEPWKEGRAAAVTRRAAEMGRWAWPAVQSAR